MNRIVFCLFCFVFFCSNPHKKNLHWLSERLASLSIMVAQSRVSLKPLNTIVLWCTGGFRRVSSIVPPWCRETLVSWKALVVITVVFPVCFKRRLYWYIYIYIWIHIYRYMNCFVYRLFHSFIDMKIKTFVWTVCIFI